MSVLWITLALATIAFAGFTGAPWWILLVAFLLAVATWMLAFTD